MSATKEKYTQSVGRRKTSVARVRITPTQSKGGITVNDRPFEDYFPTTELQKTAGEPLVVSEMEGAFVITALITGGGIHSQAEALSHGLARAISTFKEELRPTLKKAKLLTRDARAKERRKFGLKKARKSPQWSKR
ncbi:MAG TPA: 30S ribosomal protein S9 [Candidatus Paceibacterota bacterium]|nr:30S ribosomal protein S9 [Candidatus Paceibacterota bacterium]